MRHLLRRTGTVTVATAATLAVVGVSIAAYSANGSGTATATTIKAQALSVSSDIADGLFPGSSETVTLTITNPNPYAVDVTELATTGVKVVKSDGSPSTCAASNFTLADYKVPVTVPAGGTADTTGLARMAFEAGDECQDVVVGFAVNATGVQASPQAG